MAALDITYERFDGHEVMRRWPQFRLDGDHGAIFQADGGILDIRKAVAVHLALARGNGATVVPDAEVPAIDDSGDHIRLRTSAGDFEADRSSCAPAPGRRSCSRHNSVSGGRSG